MSAFLRAFLHSLIRVTIVVVVFGIGGPNAWRRLALCLWDRDWVALGHYTDVVYWEWVHASPFWVYRQGNRLVYWLNGLLPEASESQESLDQTPF